MLKHHIIQFIYNSHEQNRIYQSLKILHVAFVEVLLLMLMEMLGVGVGVH